MNIRRFLIAGISMLASGIGALVLAGEAHGQYVRIAELEIDPAQMESFRTAARESIETSIRVEPGVRVLYAVHEKDNPARVIVFEVYTDEDAYKTHLETPHFRKFRATTEKMVVSRKLLDAVPIVLGAKER